MNYLGMIRVSMLQAVSMYADLFIDEKKQLSCYYNISHIFRQHQSIQRLIWKTSRPLCTLEYSLPTFIGHGCRTDITHNTIKALYNFINSSHRIANTWMDLEVELNYHSTHWECANFFFFFGKIFLRVLPVL